MEDTKEKLTPEQIEERKKEMLQYYDNQIPFLTRQREYETLVTDLDELRMRQVFAQVKIANLLAQPPKEDLK